VVKEIISFMMRKAGEILIMQMINTRYYHGRFWDKNLGLKMPP
jgi:hypothetical protein